MQGKVHRELVTLCPGGTMALDTLRDLFVNELRDLYSAEKQLLKALPKLAKAVSNDTLRGALEGHLEETRVHVERLERIFKSLDVRGGGKKCHGMQGLIEEGDEARRADGDDAVRDAGIIAAAQRVEHYETAGYGCAVAFARSLGEDEIATLLVQTREEEEAADDKLTAIAEAKVNPAALKAGGKRKKA